MSLGVAQGITVLILGVVAVIVLLWVLVIVHKQAARVKELEMRMNAVDKLEANDATEGESQ